MDLATTSRNLADELTYLIEHNTGNSSKTRTGAKASLTRAIENYGRAIIDRPSSTEGDGAATDRRPAAAFELDVADASDIVSLLKCLAHNLIDPATAHPQAALTEPQRQLLTYPAATAITRDPKDMAGHLHELAAVIEEQLPGSAPAPAPYQGS